MPRFGWPRVTSRSPARRLAEAGRLADAGDGLGALTVYDQLLAELPENPHENRLAATARFNRAQLLTELERPAEAVEGYRELFTARQQVNRSDVRSILLLAGYNLADLLAELGELDDALAVYDSLLDTARNQPVPDIGELAEAARLNRAGLLARMGHPDQALTAYDQMLGASQPGEAQPLLAAASRAGLLADLGRPTEALTAYDELLTEHAGPDEDWPLADARARRAGLLADLGRPEAALAGYDELLARHQTGSGQPELESRVFGALLARADLLDQLHRFEDARAAYQRIIDTHGHRSEPGAAEIAATAAHRLDDLIARAAPPGRPR